MSRPIVSLGRGGRGCRRPLVGEAGEARVHDGSDDGANDPGCHVQPGISEIAWYDYRGQGPRRVEGGPCEGPAHDDVEGQSHPDRKRRENASAACDRSAEHHRHQEEGEYRLDHETGRRRDRDGRGAQGEVVRERRHAEAGGRTAHNKSAPVTAPTSWLTI